MPLPFNAFSSTQRMDAVIVHQPNLQRLRVHDRVHWQRNDEYGPPRCAVEFDQAAVATDQILRDAEPKTRAVGAAGNQRIKNGFANFVEHAGPLSSN